MRKGTKELAELVNDLVSRIDEKKWWKKKLGSAKVVLKEDEIKRLKRRMKNAIRLLSLSYQFHTAAMIQLQPDIIATRVSNHVSLLLTQQTAEESESLVVKTTSSSTDEQQKSIVTKQYDSWTLSSTWLQYLFGQVQYTRHQRLHARGRENIFAKYQFPDWLWNRAVQCEATVKLSGWKLNLHTNRRCPDDAPIFQLIRKNEFAKRKQLLQNREASLTDRDRFGNTALHLAALFGKVEMMEFLISNGADPMEFDDNQYTPLDKFLMNFQHTKCVPENILEAVRLLLDAGAAELLIENLTILFRRYIPPDLFRYLRDRLYPPIWTRDPVERLSLLKRRSFYMFFSYGNAFSSLDSMVNNGKAYDQGLLAASTDFGTTFLHILAQYMSTSEILRNSWSGGGSFIFIPSRQDLEHADLNCDYWENWSRFICKVVTAGASPCATDNDGLSPLGSLLQFLCVFNYPNVKSWTILIKVHMTLPGRGLMV